MKFQRIIPLIFSAIVILGLPGLAFSQEEKDATQPDPAQLARGAKAWAEQCSRCHNIRSPGELTDEEWFVSTTHMRVRANIPGNIIDDILAFLQASNKDE